VKFRFSGYVSACTAAQGRSTKDRQFFYVNQREVDYSKLAKVGDEVYSMWNQGKYPMLIVFVEVDAGV